MFMLISKSTKYTEIMHFLDVKFNSDHIDSVNRLKKDYKYFQIDNIGNIVAAQKGSEIILNSNVISKYHLKEIEVKRNFTIEIRKQKLNSVMN
jgi:hypothetical protein